MRTILTSLAISICLNLFAQYPQSATSSVSAEDVIDFIDSSMGKKVGNGICFNLVEYAYGDKKEFIKKWCDKKKYRIKTPEVGSAIEFDNVVYYNKYGKNIIPSHIGIVYEIGANGNIIYAEQNVNVSKKNKSHVILSEMNYKKIKSGKIRFYRFN